MTAAQGGVGEPGQGNPFAEEDKRKEEEARQQAAQQATSAYNQQKAELEAGNKAQADTRRMIQEQYKAESLPEWNQVPMSRLQKENPTLFNEAWNLYRTGQTEANQRMPQKQDVSTLGGGTFSALGNLLGMGGGSAPAPKEMPTEPTPEFMKMTPLDWTHYSNEDFDKKMQAWRQANADPAMKETIWQHPAYQQALRDDPTGKKAEQLAAGIRQNYMQKNAPALLGRSLEYQGLPAEQAQKLMGHVQAGEWDPRRQTLQRRSPRLHQHHL
jgi:hypothetical protein